MAAGSAAPHSMMDSITAEQFPVFAEKATPGRLTTHLLTRAILGHAIDASVEAPHVLVVGAGGGEEVIQLAEGHPAWRFAAVDPNDNMVNIGKQRVAEKGLSNEVNWTQAPLAGLEGTGFDAATCILTAHFVPDNGEKQQFYADIHRRLKAGAPLVVVSPSYDRNGRPDGATAFDKLSDEDRFNFELQFQHARVQGVPEERAAHMREKAILAHVVSEARELELLHAAGFSRIYRFFQAGMLKGWVAHA